MRVDALHLGQEYQHPRANQDGDLCGQRVVVAESDLVGRSRIVLVDDRHSTEGKEGAKGVPCVHVGGPVRHVTRGEQDLRSREILGRERLFPGPLLSRLPRAEAAWSFGKLRGLRSSPNRERPSAIAPDETTHTGEPPRTTVAISRARDWSTDRRTRPRGPTIRLEPSLTTTGALTGAACRHR